MIVVAGFLVFCLWSAGVVLTLPSWLALVFGRRDLELALLVAKQAPLAGEIGAIESGLKDFNRKLWLYEQAEKNVRPVLKPVEAILKTAPAAISLRNIFYERSSQTNPERIALKGRARTRSSFLSFVKTLEDSGEFKQIHSPISNLLKETDLEFSLVLDLQ